MNYTGENSLKKIFALIEANFARSSTSDGVATSANKVNKSITVKLNGGNVEGTSKYTFDGSTEKNIDITPTGIGASTYSKYTATIPSTSWTSGANGYSKSITVNGILASDAPIISAVLSGTKSTDEAIIENWNCISRIVPSANKITVYAYGDKPTVNIPIQILCVRG